MILAVCPPLAGEGTIIYFTVTVTGSENRIRPEGPERPPGGSSNLPDFSSSGSSVPKRKAAVTVYVPGSTGARKVQVTFVVGRTFFSTSAFA